MLPASNGPFAIRLGTEADLNLTGGPDILPEIISLGMLRLVSEGADMFRGGATKTGPGRIRTFNQRIMSPMLYR